MRGRDSVFARHVRHPDRAEVRRDSCGAEAVVKNGLYDRRSVFDVVIDGEGEMRDGCAVMSVMLRMDAGMFFEVVHRLVKGAHEVIENPGAFGRIEVLGFNEVEFGEGCKLWGHPSERGTTSFETGPDVGPVVNGNFAGLIKGFTTCELLPVPRRRDEAGFGRFDLRPQVIHGLNLFLRSHAVNGFHYGWHGDDFPSNASIIPKIVEEVLQ